MFHSIVREHQQKTFVTLSGFWPLRGLGDLSESGGFHQSNHLAKIGLIACICLVFIEYYLQPNVTRNKK